MATTVQHKYIVGIFPGTKYVSFDALMDVARALLVHTDSIGQTKEIQCHIA